MWTHGEARFKEGQSLWTLGHYDRSSTKDDIEVPPGLCYNEE